MTNILPAFRPLIADAPADSASKVTELVQALSKRYAERFIALDREMTEASEYARAAFAISRGEPGASAADLNGFSAEVVRAFAEAAEPVFERLAGDRAAKIAAAA